MFSKKIKKKRNKQKAVFILISFILVYQTSLTILSAFYVLFFVAERTGIIYCA